MNGYVEYPDGAYHEIPDVLTLRVRDGIVEFWKLGSRGSGEDLHAAISLKDHAVLVYLADAPIAKGARSKSRPTLRST